MRNQSDNLDDLQKQKVKREIEKTELEIKQLKRFWLFNPNTLTPLLVTMLTALLAVVGYFITGADKLLEIKKERIAYEEEKLKDTIGMIDRRFNEMKADTVKMRASADSLAANNQKLFSTNKSLNVEKEMMIAENRNLSEEAVQAHDQLKVKTRELGRSKVAYFLPIIDSIQADFTPNSAIYFQLKRNLNQLDKIEGGALITEYANDTNKLLSSRLCVLLALYKANKDIYAFKKIQSLLEDNLPSLILSANYRFDAIGPILNSKEWLPEEYHEIATRLNKKLLTIEIKGCKFKDIVRFISKDYKCSLDLEPSAFIDYYRLYRKYCQFEERSTRVYNDYYQASIFPKIVTEVMWYDLMIKGKRPDNSNMYREEIFRSKMMGLDRVDLRSLDYWKVWGEKHKRIIERLLEEDLHSYSEHVDLLKNDTRQE